ncbi:MAG TPA: type II toxin-antitoxin system VapC family toxin, partial [Fimbriimonas sp.]|nr:type II toxin-antitoxin system VapC family toxin [Fimbriimonas sp.]
MRLLIDTQIILWLLADDARLSTGAKEKLKTQENEVFYSVASLWEIGIKRNLGRLPVTPLEVAKAMDESGFTRL